MNAKHVEELQRAKVDLETAIRALLVSFEQQSGLSVNNVYLVHAENRRGKKFVVAVCAEVQI